MAVHKRVSLAVAPAYLALLLVVPAAAADLQWNAYGNLPAGYAAFSIAQDPSTPASAWAATMGAGLQHTDDGKSWKQVAPGVLPNRVWKLAIDPSKGPQGPPPMYLGTAGQGVFKSLDGGKTWTASVQGLASPGARNVRGIAMGPGELMIATSDGAYRSADGARTWQPAGLGGDDLSAIAYARYGGPPTVLASIDGVNNPGSRLVLTKDAGATWTPVKQGVPSDIVISSLAAGPVRSDANLRTVFLAGSAGVFKSDDQGQTWGQLSGLPAQGYGSVATSPADANIVYVASDGGGGGGGGVWRSTDRGGSWTALPNGISEKAVTALSVGRDNPATVLAAAWNPDKPVSLVYSVSDTQATPSGQPEGGVCPEPSCQGGTQPIEKPSPSGASPTASATASPCVTAPPGRPSPSSAESSSPAASPSTGPTAGPSASASPSLVPCAAPSASLPGQPHADIPVGVAVGAVVVLGVLLVGSIVVTRLRG